MRPLLAIDSVLKRIPGLRLLAWNTVIYGERRAMANVGSADIARR
jgi:hypothetical protein